MVRYAAHNGYDVGSNPARCNFFFFINLKKLEMLYYSKYNAIFEGDGFLQEKVLLLKFFDNYSISYFIKIIKTLEKNLSITLNFSFIPYLISLYKNLFKFLDLSKKTYLNCFLCKRFIAFYFVNFLEKLYSIYPDHQKYLLFFKTTLKTKKKNRLFYSQKTFFDQNYVSSRVLKKKHKVLYRKQFKFLYNFPRNTFFKFLNVPTNYNLYVVGESLDFYQGSVTPFNRAQFSWLVSTGLKTDIECDDLDVKLGEWWEDFTDATGIDLNFYKEYPKSLVFKLSNFNKKITKALNIKKQVRHAYVFGMVNFFERQLFISEKFFPFILKQI